MINVSGHRIGTAEVESALVGHPKCAEAAVVPVDHPIKGQGIYAFVTLMEGVAYEESLKKELVVAVREQIGAFAAPDVIHWAPGLPKTRSGKIMRRVRSRLSRAGAALPIGVVSVPQHAAALPCRGVCALNTPCRIVVLAAQVLRKIAAVEEDQLGDTSTLADPGVVDVLLELRGK